MPIGKGSAVFCSLSRFEHGEMTQEALARRIKVTRQTIISIEAAK